MTKLTYPRIIDPQVGDAFHEWFVYRMWVVAVNVTHVLIMEAQAPCTVPDDGKWRVMERMEFRKRFIYGGIPDTCWVDYLGCEPERIQGWIDTAPADLIEQFFSPEVADGSGYYGLAF